MVREPHEARDLILRGGVDVDPARRRAGRRARRLPADRRAGRPRGRMFSPHTWSNGLRPGRQPAPRAGRLHLPVRRGAVRPAGVVGGAARLAAAGGARDRSRRHDRAAARARPRRRRPTSTPSSATGSADAGRSRAAVLREPGAPLASRRSRSSRRAPARCSCGSPRPACATPTCTSPTATSATAAAPIVPGHEGAGVVEAVGAGRRRRGRGDPVAFCFVPACRACRACRGGRPGAVRRPRRTPGRARCSTARRGCARAGGGARTALQLRLVLRRRARRAGGVRRPDPAPSSRCGRPRCSAAAWSPASARCATPRGWPSARRVASSAAAASACRSWPARGWPVPGAIVAVDRDPATLERALARGATHAVDAGPSDPVAAVRAACPGGVDHAFEVVGRPGDDPPRLGRAAPGRDRDRGGHRAARRRGLAPRHRAALREGPEGLLLRLGQPRVELGRLAGSWPPAG